MVCFPSTTSSGRHSHPSKVTALVSVAQQGTSYSPYLMISLFHASVCFFSTELLFALNHGTMYAIYAPFIQRIINYKTDREFGYDGKHGA
jgi:hypothetical protein